MYGKKIYTYTRKEDTYKYTERKEDVYIPQVLDARAPADKDEAA
jgi:uncharacterized protein YcgL (UPF0745 family)